MERPAPNINVLQSVICDLELRVYWVFANTLAYLPLPKSISYSIWAIGETINEVMEPN